MKVLMNWTLLWRVLVKLAWRSLKTLFWITIVCTIWIKVVFECFWWFMNWEDLLYFSVKTSCLMEVLNWSWRGLSKGIPTDWRGMVKNSSISVDCDVFQPPVLHIHLSIEFLNPLGIVDESSLTNGDWCGGIHWIIFLHLFS